MTLEKANRIAELRIGEVMHSWRRISEIICDEFPDEDQSLHGMQFHGIDLCLGAMIFLNRVSDISDLSDEIRDKWAT